MLLSGHLPYLVTGADVPVQSRGPWRTDSWGRLTDARFSCPHPATAQLPSLAGTLLCRLASEQSFRVFKIKSHDGKWV